MVHNSTDELLEEVQAALKMVKGYGSIEIFIQNNIVTQITVRNIKKTQVGINNHDGAVETTKRTFRANTGIAE